MERARAAAESDNPLQQFERDAVEKVYGAIVRAGHTDEAEAELKPVLRPQDPMGNTATSTSTQPRASGTEPPGRDGRYC